MIGHQNGMNHLCVNLKNMFITDFLINVVACESMMHADTLKPSK